jgi:hypothetical protein
LGIFFEIKINKKLNRGCRYEKSSSSFSRYFFIRIFCSLCKGSSRRLAGPKPYQGAGIGKEVSEEAKTKAKSEKQEFGQVVKEEAQNKTRIIKHKALKQQQKEQKKEQKQIRKKARPENATSQ